MFDDPGPKGERDPDWKPTKTGWSRWEQLTEWDVYVETAKKFSEMMGREVSTEEAKALCKAQTGYGIKWCTTLPILTNLGAYSSVWLSQLFFSIND